MRPQKRRDLLPSRLTLLPVPIMSVFFLLWGLLACSTSGSVPHSPTATPPATCSIHSAASASPITGEGLQKMFSLPGHPFASVATHDGRWIFVSLNVPGAATSNGIAILQQDGQTTKLAHIISLPDAPAGLALTQDEHFLVVADQSGVAVLDTARVEVGGADALLGVVSDGNNAGTIEVVLSKDDRYVFATDENAHSMSVINFQRARMGDFSAHAYVGRVPLDFAPVGMALSPNNRYLYATSEISAEAVSQVRNGSTTPVVGTLTVVDVARAEHDPGHAVLERVFAGCSPVRVVLTSSGDLAWVTARGSNTLLAFKTSLLLTDPAHALIATIPVGPAPVGLILIRQDSVIVVANSNRFVGNQSSETVILVDVKRALSGRSALLGSLTVGSFPREMALDGQTLLLTNYNSNALSLIDISKLPTGDR